MAEPCFCPSLCLWPWVSHLGIRGHLYEAWMWCQALFRVSLCVTSSTPYSLPRSWMASSPCFTFITPPGGSASPSVRREVPPSHSLWGLNKKVDLQRKYVPLPQIGGGGTLPSALLRFHLTDSLENTQHPVTLALGHLLPPDKRCKKGPDVYKVKGIGNMPFCPSNLPLSQKCDNVPDRNPVFFLHPIYKCLSRASST